MAEDTDTALSLALPSARVAMPVLEISQSELDQAVHDKDTEAAIWRRVLGVMLFPLNETERIEAEAAMQVRYLDRRLERRPADEVHELRTAQVRSLIRGAKALPTFLEQELQRSTYAARAGHVLRIYLEAHFKGEKPQLERAKSLAADYLRISIPNINKAWGEYRFASHFWAAGVLMCNGPPELPPDFPESDMAGVPLSNFLATSETLRKYGESRLSGRPALDQPEMNWRLPEQLDFHVQCTLFVNG
jgi:hypothetical protein